MAQLPTIKTSTTKTLRVRRHARVRAKVAGTSARPRLVFSKSNRFVSAQLVDDQAGRTLLAAHGRMAKGPLSAQASAVGAALAQKATAAGITTVVFDRGGYSYRGQVKALAEAARAGGLVF